MSLAGSPAIFRSVESERPRGRTRGFLATFEGGEGSGKSTQIERLADFLRTRDLDVVTAREPGTTQVGEAVREILLRTAPERLAPEAELALFLAARAELVAEVVRPALEHGAWVVCDRYVDSSVAYQGVGRGLGLDRVLELNLAAVGGLMPDRTFLLELDVSRLPARLPGDHDRLEREAGDFHARVAAGYRELAERFPERIVVLDATRPAEDLAEEVYGALRVRA